MSSTTDLNKLQRIQNKCIKLIKGDANKNKFKELKILKIMDLIRLENCKFGFKLRKHEIPARSEELSRSDQYGKSLEKKHKYNTRHKEMLKKALAHDKRYKSCIIYHGTSYLEALKVETQNKPSLQSFTSHCKKEIWSDY